MNSAFHAVSIRGHCRYCGKEAYTTNDRWYLCSRHYYMYYMNDPRLEWEALINLVNQSASAATPPPMPTTYPSDNPPAPPCAGTEPETHQGSEAYDASSDH